MFSLSSLILGFDYCSLLLMQVLFGILLTFYLPALEPYPGYTPVRSESVDENEYEELPAGEQICPEKHVNIISSVYNCSFNCD